VYTFGWVGGGFLYYYPRHRAFGRILSVLIAFQVFTFIIIKT
jgi:hypothetical protein